MPLKSRAALALLQVASASDPAERVASWRHAMTALGGGPRVEAPPALEGVSGDALREGVRVALERGLADDLDWQSPASAAVGLYELSLALPPSRERTEIARRALGRLYDGTAETFVAVATRVALGPARALQAAPLRARVGLVMDLPAGADVDPGPLAFALCGRRDLFDTWLARPATGALPGRRLAARILEHAATEVVARHRRGDTYPMELLAGARVEPVLQLLLADREPLVWRHAAVARGLLASIDARSREQIDLALDPSLTTTEWRRGAVSLVACLACEPEAALGSCKRILRGELLTADPGLAAAMIWGLSPVVRSEPLAAEELLGSLVALSSPEVVDAAAGFLAECPGFGVAAREVIAERLRGRPSGAGPLADALARRAARELDAGAPGSTLTAGIRAALRAYQYDGARAACERALEVAALAEHTLSALERESPEHGASLRAALALADLDAAVLERARLSHLLLLGRSPKEQDTSVPEIDQLHERLGAWLLSAEDAELALGRTPADPLLRRTRLRTLLHLVDWESAGRAEGDLEQTERLSARLQRAARVLARQLAREGEQPGLHRILCATFARSLDAALREGVVDVADVLLAVSAWLDSPSTLAAIASASTHPDLGRSLEATSEFLALAQGWRAERVGSAEGAGNVARAVSQLSRRLGVGGSYRAEALRSTIVRLGRALETVAAARGISELVDASGASDPLAELEHSTESLRRLALGAARRLAGDEAANSGEAPAAVPLSALLKRGVTSGVPATAEQIARAVAALSAGLPEVFAAASTAVLARLPALPPSPASEVYAIPLSRKRMALPDWLLPKRTIGGFYVEKAIGSGGVSSVFIARRIEERNEGEAERFALKVPEYDPATARTLSEEEFYDLFRHEAGALLALPTHRNLARFVTFDLASKPKPILVMELIRGPSLDRLIRSRALTTERGLAYLDAILRGLEAMHDAGVGHLDVKPSNVILRDGGEAVLVDFGLSGRRLRPGCGTLEYCAPEILGCLPDGYEPRPEPADVYAFGCMAFEVLTGRILFDGGDEHQLVARHVAHDGSPPELATLASDPRLGDIATLLSRCLRRDPRQRLTVPQVRATLRALGASIAERPWPLAPRGQRSSQSGERARAAS